MKKKEIKNKIVELLSGQNEIDKIVIFGSFNKSKFPNDIDIAIIQNSSENYLSLALKYRKLLRNISKEIPIDIFPIFKKKEMFFWDNEFITGEVIYAKGN